MDNEKRKDKNGPVFLPGIDLTLWFGIGLSVSLCLALLVAVICTA